MALSDTAPASLLTAHPLSELAWMVAIFLDWPEAQMWPARVVAAAGAEENADLLPRLGGTTSEYEARTRGLTRPAPPSTPFSVTLVADSQGHFLVEPIVNGTCLRMLVRYRRQPQGNFGISLANVLATTSAAEMVTPSRQPDRVGAGADIIAQLRRKLDWQAHAPTAPRSNLCPCHQSHSRISSFPGS
jgi:hypothetical protein